MTLTILEGTTFCICDERGDLGDETGGFFADDTRYLSVFRLTIEGRLPLLLTSDKVEYYSAAFFLRNPPTETLPQDTLSIARSRFVGDAMQDRITIQNQGVEPVSFQLALEIGSDFADIFTVKSYDFSFGDPLNAPPLPPLAEPTFDAEAGQFLLADPASSAATQVILSRAAEPRGGRLGVVRDRAGSRASAGSSWSTSCPRRRARSCIPKTAERRFGEELQHVRDSLTAWQLRVPQLRADWDDLERAVSQSISDLAALRIRAKENGRVARRPPARRRHAVVHDGVRPRLDRHRASRRCCWGRSWRRASSRSSPSSRRPRTTRTSTPSRGRSSTRCGAARPPSRGSRATTARSTRRRSISCCCPRCGDGPTTRAS